MTFLYNCKHAGDQYRITKFDEHMNVESSYLCTTKECECPAGSRPRCRHREMLPRFIQRGTIGTEWCYDYDRGGWVQMEIAELLPMPDARAKDWSRHEAEIEQIAAMALPAPKRSWRRF